jgi:hypothetical protein
MVTCMVCRHDIADGGHQPNCPILIEELRRIRARGAVLPPSMASLMPKPPMPPVPGG